MSRITRKHVQAVGVSAVAAALIIGIGMHNRTNSVAYAQSNGAIVVPLEVLVRDPSNYANVSMHVTGGFITRGGAADSASYSLNTTPIEAGAGEDHVLQLAISGAPPRLFGGSEKSRSVPMQYVAGRVVMLDQNDPVLVCSAEDMVPMH